MNLIKIAQIAYFGDYEFARGKDIKMSKKRYVAVHTFNKL